MAPDWGHTTTPPGAGPTLTTWSTYWKLEYLDPYISRYLSDCVSTNQHCLNRYPWFSCLVGAWIIIDRQKAEYTDLYRIWTQSLFSVCLSVDNSRYILSSDLSLLNVCNPRFPVRPLQCPARWWRQPGAWRHLGVDSTGPSSAPIGQPAAVLACDWSAAATRPPGWLNCQNWSLNKE